MIARRLAVALAALGAVLGGIGFAGAPAAASWTTTSSGSANASAKALTLLLPAFTTAACTGPSNSKSVSITFDNMQPVNALVDWTRTEGNKTVSGSGVATNGTFSLTQADLSNNKTYHYSFGLKVAQSGWASTSANRAAFSVSC